MSNRRCGDGAPWCARADEMFNAPGLHVIDVHHDGSGSYGAIDFGALQAGVVAMIPALALHLVLQRYYVNGLLNGALRG